MSSLFISFCVLLFVGGVIGFHGVPLQPKFSMMTMMASLSNADGLFQSNVNTQGKKVVVEFIAKKAAVEKKKVASLRTTYQQEVRESSKLRFDALKGKVANFISNPINVMVAVYFFFFSIKKINQVLSFFYNLVTGKKGGGEQDEQAYTKATGLRTFECNRCGMQVFPARDRVYAMLHNPRFRCSSCGAKAASFFDIHDMEDPRAVARVERLKREKEEEYGEDDEENAVEDDE